MAQFPLLEQSEEDALHAERLLGFESKLYKQLARCVFGSDAPVALNDKTLQKASTTDESADDRQISISKWRNDTLLEFAAFESNLTRVQFLLRSNELERQRYAVEKQRLIDTAQSVRDGNAQLHAQLADAKAALEVRKGYDALAAEITERKNPLKSREETHMAIERLQADNAALELESADYANTWGERREQFGKIVDEGMNMLRLIRDEKEEAERHDDGLDGEEDAASPAAAASRGETPKPGEDGPAGSKTDSKGQSSLRVETGVDDVNSVKSSRGPSPQPENGDNASGQAESMQVDAADDDVEEGEAEESPGPDDKMEMG